VSGQNNRVSAVKEEDYYTILGIRQKHMFLFLLTIVLNFLFIGVFYGNPINFAFSNPLLFVVLMIPIIFVYLLIKGIISTPLYNAINSLFKITSIFNTKYLTGNRKNVTDFVINSPNEKIVVFKLDSDDFYNKTEDEKYEIFSRFNLFLLNSEQNLLFRVINKPLNLNKHFDMIESNVDKNSIIQEAYFHNFADEYIKLSRNIPDYEYYLEIHFPSNYTDNQIETQLKIIFDNIGKFLNIATAPRLLRGNEITTYIRKIITSGSEYASNFSIPIVTDY
jgi:hypothetical protein